MGPARGAHEVTRPYPFLRNDPGGDVDIEIAADGLCFVNEAGRSAPIDWHRIRQVRLYCKTVKAQIALFSLNSIPTLAYFCELTLDDKKRVVLVNGCLDAKREWAALDADYRAFVLSLHERLQAASTSTRFRAGTRWSGFLADALVQVWPRSGQLWSFAFLLLLIPLFSRNFPRRYHPRQLPQRLLPPD